MDNYIEIKKQLEKNNETLEKANKKFLELKQNSRDIIDIIETLKVSKLNKDNYILSKEDKYTDVVNEMYKDNVLDNNAIGELELKNKKDDFEI